MKKITGLELAMYIIAGVFGVLFIWMAISSTSYIADYAAQYGVTIGSMFGEALKYILTQSINYLGFGLVFFVAGKLIGKVEKLNNLLTFDVFDDFELPEECVGCEQETCEGCEAVAEEVKVEEPVVEE